MFANRLFLRVAFVTLLSLCVGGLLTYFLETKREVETRSMATLLATTHAKSLESHLSHSLSATYALAAILKQNKTIPNFDSLTRDLIDRYGGITNLQLAPNGIISQIFPLEGHKRALGYDLTENSYAIRAIKSKELTLEGPIDLIQGGVAVLGRYPVFLPNEKTGEDEFWGFTTALIELSKLLDGMKIHGLISRNYDFILSHVNPTTGKDVTFSKSGNEILEKPVSVKIQLPNGQWELSIAPKEGWKAGYYLLIESLLVLFSCGAISFIAYKHFSKTRELQIQKNEFETIFNSAPTLIGYKDNQNKILRVNDAVVNFLGLEKSQIEGKHCKGFFPNHYEKYYLDDLEVIKTGKPKLGIVHPYHLNSGKTGWVKIDKIPYFDKNGVIGGILLFAIDITRQKEAEDKIFKNSLQLENANKELQSFASIASHDLQEPLRKIITFGDRLKTQIPATDENAHNYLERMQNSSSRMKSLVEDLLQLTNVEAVERSYRATDLNKVVHTVLEDLETRLKESKGNVNLLNLPIIDADPFQIHQLFLNLIGNALKFNRPGIPPVINFGSIKTETGHWKISVEDNGIGIEEIYLDRIFKPFERLHGRSAYEGTGIGLTICNKIVSRHGGEITVKRHSTHGVTFHITLPEKQDNGEVG
jgi:PAS domain S-box-containing protein